MKKPSTLYRYNCFESGEKKISKHKITKNCCPQVEIDIFSKPEYMNDYGGVLWRCQCDAGDFHGYATREEAIREEILNTQKRINVDTKWVKKLKGV